MNQYSVLHGTQLKQNRLIRLTDPVIKCPGMESNAQNVLCINEDVLSKHVLFLGETGSGKTNALYFLINQIKKRMTENDVMIVFDTKGDFYQKFYSKGDAVLGTADEYKNLSAKWNIYREILSDGWDIQKVRQNIQELSWAMFNDAIKNSKDAFFPNAARDLFSGIIQAIMEEGKDDIEFKKRFFYNSELKKAIEQTSILEVKEMLELHPATASITSYLGDGNNGQALGVYAEMLGVIRPLLTGIYSDKGDYSVRNFVAERGGKTLFLEYDLSIGNVLTPMYSLLFDLAIKEALGRKRKTGNIYFICDELKLLPQLQHIDDAVNFGRGLGVKMICGLQSVSQLSEQYGEYRANNIMAGFSTLISFRVNDPVSREYIKSLYGTNALISKRTTLANAVQEEKVEGHVVEDWDVNELKIGEAIVGFPFSDPFVFRFDMFGR